MTFVSDVAALAASNVHPVDNSTIEWASRAFSCMILVGNLDETSDEVKESLAIALAKAPIDVLVGGTMHTVGVAKNFNDN